MWQYVSITVCYYSDWWIAYIDTALMPPIEELIRWYWLWAGKPLLSSCTIITCYTSTEKKNSKISLHHMYIDSVVHPLNIEKELIPFLTPSLVSRIPTRVPTRVSRGLRWFLLLSTRSSCRGPKCTMTTEPVIKYNNYAFNQVCNSTCYCLHAHRLTLAHLWVVSSHTHYHCCYKSLL